MNCIAEHPASFVPKPDEESLTSMPLKNAYVVAILTICLSACVGGPARPLAGSGSQELATIIVQNNQNFAYTGVLIGHCDTRAVNRLSEGETIQPGTSRSFSVGPGCYWGHAEGRHPGLATLVTLGSPQIAVNLPETNLAAGETFVLKY